MLMSRIELNNHIARLDELINTLIIRVDALENRLNALKRTRKED